MEKELSKMDKGLFEHPQILNHVNHPQLLVNVSIKETRDFKLEIYQNELLIAKKTEKRLKNLTRKLEKRIEKTE